MYLWYVSHCIKRHDCWKQIGRWLIKRWWFERWLSWLSDLFTNMVIWVHHPYKNPGIIAFTGTQALRGVNGIRSIPGPKWSYGLNRPVCYYFDERLPQKKEITKSWQRWWKNGLVYLYTLSEDPSWHNRWLTIVCNYSFSGYDVTFWLTQACHTEANSHT